MILRTITCLTTVLLLAAFGASPQAPGPARQKYPAIIGDSTDRRAEGESGGGGGGFSYWGAPKPPAPYSLTNTPPPPPGGARGGKRPGRETQTRPETNAPPA